MPLPLPPQAQLRNIEDAYYQISHAIETCLRLRKPVYISVP